MGKWVCTQCNLSINTPILVDDEDDSVVCIDCGEEMRYKSN